MKSKYKVGYTQGVYDMFHVGHLNLIKHAKERCEYLIVGVNSDELVNKYKNKNAVISENDRARIVSELRSVDEVIIVSTLDKREIYKDHPFDAVFIGDDWMGSERWIRTEMELKEVGADVVYLPYTIGVSSSGYRGKTSIGELDEHMITDKEYCMSSYLAFRFVVDEKKCFADCLPHKDHIMIPENQKMPCRTASDIDGCIRTIIDKYDLKNAGLLLSGGIDSAILASYMPKGTKAYTARCIGTNAVDETEQAKKYCDIYGLEHIILDVTWEDYVTAMVELALFQGSPIISNEPQAYKIAKQAKEDGIKCLVHGDTADAVFGGYSLMLSKDWTMDEWIWRSIYVRPEEVMRSPADIYRLYDMYKREDGLADNEGFINDIYGRATAGAMTLPCRALGLDYVDPYEEMYMPIPFDMHRIRNGESKYLLRELFHMRYPDLDIPEKKPMSRPADAWMSGWGGTQREEFVPGCTEKMSGEEKLLVYALERFLNIIDAR